MQDRNQLYENYENALFAFLMDGLADAQGMQAIEKSEQLQGGSTAVLPEGMEQRQLKAIRKRFAKKKVQLAGHYTVKAAGRLMMALGITALLFTSVFATSEAVRVNTLNLVIEVFGESTDFQFMQGPVANASPTIEARWLPSGFPLVKQGENEIAAWQIYENSIGDFVRMECTNGDGTVLAVDTEGATTVSSEINGNDALISQEDGITQIMWAVRNEGKFVVLTSSLTDLDTLLHIAREINF